MKNTTNYALKKPEGTDVVNVDDFNGNADIIDKKLKELELNEIFYAVATGSANTYAVTIPALSTLSTYFDGLAVCVKINVASTGASTLNVNGWGARIIVDSLGNQITNGGLKIMTPYTLRFNGVVFMLQGKGGGGNVTADKLLIGYTATGDIGQVNGSMANQPASVNVINVGTSTYSPNNRYFRIPQGAYITNASSGYPEIVATASQIDSSIISSNIKSGAKIVGVSGSPSVVDTADALATASQLLAGASAYVNGLKVLGAIQSRGATTITPGTADQTIASGQFLSGVQTISGSPSLISSNIKSGISIFGVQGSPTVVDSADANLDPQYLLSGYSGYDDGVKKAGTLANMTSAVNIGGAESGDFYNSAGVCGGVASNSYVGAYDLYIPKGYYSGTGTNRLHIPNLLPQNIVNGVNVGWNGKAITGTATISSLGGRQYASGTFTRVSGSANVINVGFQPSIIWKTSSWENECIYMIGRGLNRFNYITTGSSAGYDAHYIATSTGFTVDAPGQYQVGNVVSWQIWG